MEDDPTKAALAGELARLEEDDERMYWQDALGVSEVRVPAAGASRRSIYAKVSEYLASH